MSQSSNNVSVCEEAWVVAFRKKVLENTERDVNTWCNIVVKTGLNKPLLEQWTSIFESQSQEVHQEMIDEAQANQTALINKIEALLEKCDSLRQELRLQMPEYGSEGLTLYEEHQLLVKRIEEYEISLNNKREEIDELLKQQNSLCCSLGWKAKEMRLSPLPLPDEIEDLKKYIESMDAIKYERIEIFVNQKFEIISLTQELNYEPNLDFQKNVLFGEDTDFNVTDDNMTELTNFLNYLKNLYEKTKLEIGDAREKVQELWLILQIEPTYCEEFLKNNTGHSLSTLNALHSEIKRCKALKIANIQVIVKRLREELVKLWDKCHVTNYDRNLFVYFTYDHYTEDLLTLHDLEIEKWKRYYNSNVEIFTMLEKRKTLWSQLLSFEEKVTSKDRYKNRGGQLLKEEKERNALSKQIPKIEEQLINLANIYEEQKGSPFLTWGETIQSIICRDRDEHEQNRKTKLNELRQVRDKTITPGKSVLTLTTCTSNQNLAKFTTPNTGAKRKLLTPAPSSMKRPRNILTSNTNLNVPQTAPPKLALNGRTILTPRFSTERAKREARRKRISQKNSKLQSKKENLPNLDYSSFEKEISNRDTCRSTIFGVDPPLATLLPLTPSATANNAYCKTPASSHGSPRSRPKLSTAPSLKLLF